MANVKDLLVNGSARVIGTIYGNATSANKLNTNAGSASQPVYFSNGIPIAITGTISNNAATATKATQDSAGQQINTTYIKGLSVSGRTITYTKGDGTTGTITTQDNNTTYSAGTGLSLSGTTFNHKNSVTAGTAQGDANKTLTFGGTFTIPTITYDAQGHITGKGTTTMTMPANPNTDTHWTTGITAGETGTTSNSATTNGNTFIKIKDNSTHRGQIKLVGSGATSVSSDANGVITISSTDNNTTYGSMSVSEGTTGTATSNRVLTAANLKGIINAHAPTKTGGGASGTWDISVSGNAATATNTDTLDGLHANDFIYYGGDDINLGAGSPASTAKTYFTDSSKTPLGMMKGYYNHNGTEYSQLYSRSGNGAYGSILRWGYADKYMYILRYQNGWRSNDWEKMDAGNADTATKLATARNIKIGNQTNSFNGSADITYNLQDILIRAGNEFNYTADGISGLWFNFKTQTRTDATTKITDYYFGDGRGSTSGVTIHASNFSGNAATASKVNNKLTVGSKNYDGSAAVTISASDLGLASAMLFLGTTTTAITDGAKTNPVAIGGSNKTVTAGNVVLYGSKEFVWTGSAWEELGNEGSYKIVQSAVADPSASGTSNTFIATISQDTNGKITATKKTVAVTNSAPTLSWGATSTIGTVAGTNLQVTMPANPNTWRGIQNNLTSDSTTDSLSAAQGKALKGLIDGKAASSHTHDDRYYTESEMNTKLSGKSDTGHTHDDRYYTESEIDTKLNGKANTSHGTHIPSTCTSITDWNSATTNGWYMGSNISNQPVTNGGWFYGLTIVHNSNYIRQIAWHFASDNSVSGTNNDRYERVKHNGTWGSWVNTSVRTAVPSNAKFTDTTYSAATTSAAGLMSAADKSKLDGIAANANKYSHPTSSGNKHIPAGGSSGQILRWSADGTAVWGADNNTWRGIQNNLTSDSTTDSLAAAQGKALKALIDGKAASSHTHNYAGSSSAGGAANSANKLATARTITLSGAVTGSASFDGSKNITINTSNSQQTLPYSSSTSQLFVTSAANQASYTLSNFVDNAVYHVYVNGFKIPNSEYTVSSSGVVTLTNPPELANQEVEIVANYTSYVTTDSSIYNSSYLNYYRQATAPSNTNALWLDTSTTTSSSSFTPKLYDGGKWNAIGGVDTATLDARYVKKSGDTMTGNLTAPKVYGAVWNDYAEFRKSDIIEPGRVVIENGDGTLSLSIKRLQRGAEVISDTYGFAIGETDECKTPIAATGRVLVYTYEPIGEYRTKTGWPVCSGPNGTVSIMTEEEEEKYPSRIIGTISEVPDYEEWGTGKVKTNGRVWIRIK